MKHSYYIVSTFLFLGLLWFEMSGGTEFEPRDVSYRVATDPFADTPRPLLQSTFGEPTEPLTIAASMPVEVATPVFAAATASSVTPAVASTTDRAVIVPASLPREIKRPREERVEDAPEEQPKIDIAPRLQTVQVAANRLNFRVGPGTRYGSLGILDRGDTLVVLREEDRWKKVRAEESGQIGWVAAWLTEPTS